MVDLYSVTGSTVLPSTQRRHHPFKSENMGEGRMSAHSWHKVAGAAPSSAAFGPPTCHVKREAVLWQVFNF